MINPTEPNIWDRLLDTLSFYQSGNFKRLDSCFERVLDSLSINLDNRAKLRNRYFHTARVLGFLELSATSQESHWSLNPPALLKTSDGYILIAPPNIAAKVPEILAEFKNHHFDIFCDDIYCKSKDVKNYSHVTLKKTKTLSVSLKQRLLDKNICIVENIAEDILPKLPPLDIIKKTCLQDSVRRLPDYYDDAERFSFNELKWISARLENYYDSALLRNRTMFRGNYNYIIRHSIEGDLKFYDVIDDEWIYLLGASLLSESLGSHYNETNSELYLPFGFRLPTLVDRLLVSNSMIRPSFNDGKWVYEKVPSFVAHKIFNLYPSLA